MILLKPKSNYLAVLHDTEALRHNGETYLSQCLADDQPPTPAGLALAFGFSSFSHLKACMKRAIERRVTDEHADNPHNHHTTVIFNPPPFLPIIDMAFSHIEDQYLRAALLDEFRASTVQYALAAYFDRQPIQKSKSTQEINQTQNQQIKVIIEDSTTASSSISPEEQEEIARLRRAVPVAAVEDRGAATVTIDADERNEKLKDIL